MKGGSPNTWSRTLKYRHLVSSSNLYNTGSRIETDPFSHIESMTFCKILFCWVDHSETRKKRERCEKHEINTYVFELNRKVHLNYI